MRDEDHRRVAGFSADAPAEKVLTLRSQNDQPPALEFRDTS